MSEKSKEEVLSKTLVPDGGAESAEQAESKEEVPSKTLVPDGAGTEKQKSKVRRFFEKLFFPRVLEGKSAAQRIAYIGVATALCIVSNMFEIKFAATQFSFTVFTSVLAGILIGSVFGFFAVFLGDAIGYLVNSMGYPYYWWVALSCSCMALLAGLVMHGFKFEFKGGVYLKLAFICAMTFLVCSVGINSSGMYFIGLKLYMPKNVLEAFTEHFGGEQTYLGYLIIRFFLFGQIYNSIVNYALLFAVVPALNAIKPLKINVR